MCYRSLTVLLVVVALLSLVPAAAAGQDRPPAPDTPPAHLGPDARPDLQGIWDFRTITPLERPAALGDKAFLTEEEAAVLEAQAETRKTRLAEPSDVRTEPLPAGGGGLAIGAYNDFWIDFGTNIVEDRRTSLIVDPPPPGGSRR